MKYYKKDNEVFAFEDDCSQDEYITQDMVRMTSSEVDKHLNPKKYMTDEQLYEIFSRFVVQINYSGSSIILHDPLHFKKKRKYKTVEMEIIDTKPYLEQPLFLNDSTSMFAKLMIDTGASHALVLNHDSDPRISIPPVNIRAKLGRGLTGDIEGHLARINALEIQDFQSQILQPEG